MGEQRPYGPDNRDGLTQRQAPGLNEVGAHAYYSQNLWSWNLGWDGRVSGGNYGSAFIQRAAVTAGLSQVTSISG